MAPGHGEAAKSCKRGEELVGCTRRWGHVGLTSGLFLGLCSLTALTAPVVTVLLWSRVPGGRAARVAARLGFIVSAQLTAVLLVAAVVNDDFGFYTSWSDLLGRTTGPVVVAMPAVPALPVGSPAALSATAQRDGVVVPIPVPGLRSRISGVAHAYLPPQYAQPAYRHVQFPVVEVLPGYPGHAGGWLTRLHLDKMLRTETAAGRARPFVVVMVDSNVASPRDTECANVAHGPQVETYLADDVRAAALRTLRVSRSASGWALMGYSTGGFCAVKIAMRRPDLFRAAVSVSGYYHALVDSTTGDLYGRSMHTRHLNDPLWRLAHLPAPPLSVLVTVSAQEAGAAETRAFLAAARPPMQVSSIITATGGHNLSAMRRVLPECVQWLSDRLWVPPAHPTPPRQVIRPTLAESR